MKTKEYLEKDKESLLKKLEASGDAQSSIRVMEEELTRILTRCSQENLAPAAALAVQNTLQTARAALPFIDTAGEVRIYERKDSRGVEDDRLSEKNIRNLLPTAMVWLLGAVMLTRAGTVSVLLGLVLSAIGYIGAFHVGRKSSGEDKAGEPPLICFTTDPQKVYHHTDMLLTVVDQQIENTMEVENTRIARSLKDDAVSGQMEEEIRLFSDLLALAYVQKDEIYAREMISDIRFYLHRQQIDVVDYDDKVARLFDLMPSGKAGTIRPALVREGTVLCKGIAAANAGE